MQVKSFDLHSFKTNEESLIGNQLRVTVSLAKLVTSESTTGQDEDNSKTEEAKEEAHTTAKGTAVAGAEVADQVVAEKNTEDYKNGNLECKTGHGNVDTCLAGTLADCRESTTSGLENEADEIGGDEDPPYKLGLDARNLGSEGLNAIVLSAKLQARD